MKILIGLAASKVSTLILMILLLIVMGLVLRNAIIRIKKVYTLHRRMEYISRMNYHEVEMDTVNQYRVL